MKKRLSSIAGRYLLPAVTIMAIAVSVIAALSFTIHSLELQVDELKVKVALTESRLATYERTMCNQPFGITDGNTTTRYSVVSAGYVRSYQVHTPTDYTPSMRYPVILSFDGIDGSGGRMESYAGLDALPAIIVYPDSLIGRGGFTAWQGAPYSLAGNYDVEFVRSILDQLPQQYCTNATETFAVGMSNGGQFATIVGCSLDTEIKAVVSVSGAYYSSCQSERRTPSLLAIHSKDDVQVLYKGDPARRLPAIPTWIKSQVESRDCKRALPMVQNTTMKSYKWEDCTDKSIVRFVVLTNQPHGWVKIPQPQGRPAETTAGYIWKFFEEVSE